MRKLLENVLSLYLVHIVRICIPLVLLPLLARRIDAESLGLYLYATAFMLWCSILVEYGFNVSSTRTISRLSNEAEIVQVVADTHSAKLFLILASIALLPLAMLLLQPFHGEPVWLFCAWGAGVASAFIPVFYYHGTERMRPLGAYEIVAGAVLISLTLGFVESEENAGLIPFFLLISRVVALLLSQAVMLRRLGWRCLHISPTRGWLTLKKEVDLFVLQALSSLYTSFNTILLGFYVGVLQVAIYGAAERLTRAGLGFIGQASNAVFPRINRLYHDDTARFHRYRRTCLWLFFLSTSVLALIASAVAPVVVSWFFDDKLNEAVPVLRILVWVAPAIALNNVLGFQYLVIEKKEKVLNKIIMAGGLVNVMLAIALLGALGMGASGMAYCWLAVEWGVTLSLILYVLLSKSAKPVMGLPSEM